MPNHARRPFAPSWLCSWLYLGPCMALASLPLLASPSRAQEPSLDELLTRAEKANDEDFISTKPDWMRVCGDDETRELERQALSLVFKYQELDTREAPNKGKATEKPTLAIRPIAPKHSATGAPTEVAPPKNAGELKAQRNGMLAVLSKQVKEHKCLHWAQAVLADKQGFIKIAADALDQLGTRYGNETVRPEIVKLRARIVSRVGTLEIRTLSKHTTIAVDSGQARLVSGLEQRPGGAMLRLAPGQHALHFTTPGHKATGTVEVAAGETLHLTVEPNAVAQRRDSESALTGSDDEVPEPTPESGYGAWPYLALAGGGVAALGGVVAAVMAGERASYYDEFSCDELNHQGCADVKSEQEQAEVLQVVSFAGAGVLVGVGIALLVMEPEAETRNETASLGCLPALGRQNGIACHWTF